MTTNDPEQAPDGVEDPRLTSLDARLREAHHTEKARTLGAPLGAALIGWVIDRFAGTTPFGLLVMLFLGFGAAISQVLRISKERAE
jgi:ATP synthase protein I